MGITRGLIGMMLLCAAIDIAAQTSDTGNYSLRIHIFARGEMPRYSRAVPEQSKAEGRANLFEKGEVRGLEFSSDCSRAIKPSIDFETYPAKWNKNPEELVVLFPVAGKENQFFTCNLKTRLRNCAYFMRNGRLDSQPVARYKEWMVKNEYDPEHGKEDPIRLQTRPAPSDSPAE